MRSVREQCVLFVLCFVILEVVPEQPRYKMIMFGLRTKPAPFLIVDKNAGLGMRDGMCHCVIILTNNDMESNHECSAGQTVICSLSLSLSPATQ